MDSNDENILTADENEADSSKNVLNSTQINEKTDNENNRDNEAKRIAERILRLIGPQFAVISLFILYLLIGAFCFRYFEPQFSKIHFTELVLFCFETLATIGYGNICPNSPIARLFTVAYSLLGIPLCMLTLVNLGKHITKLYATLVRTFKLWRKHRKLRISRHIRPSRLPWPILILFFSLCIVGSAFYSPIPSIFYLDHFYFSIISFTTIGFGDFNPNTKGNIINLLIILSNLCLGMIFWGIWFQIARDWIQRLFRFKHRRFQHARDIQVHFGRKQMRLSGVLEAVACEFKASPSQIHQVLNDLDFLISDTFDGGLERTEITTKVIK